MITIDEARKVIKMMDRNFDSHNFILAYSLGFSLSYLEMLQENNCDFAVTNGKIGSFISDNHIDLEIENPKPKATRSANIKKYVSGCTKWRRLNMNK